MVTARRRTNRVWHYSDGGCPLPVRTSIIFPALLACCVIFNLVVFINYLHLHSASSVSSPPATHIDHGKATHPIPQPVAMDEKKRTMNVPQPVPVPVLALPQRKNGHPTVVAHVVSLIKCSKQSSVTGFLDAAAVLRHSIHKNSVHAGTSKYSYKMYAIVHEECAEHARALDILGYTSLVKPSPVKLEEITPGFYKSHVEGENCCGSAEFIKLYAYTLTDHAVTVHWDMDVALFQPMDDLFDSIIFPHNSPEGQSARQRLDLQHPERPLPERIDAFITKDITSSQPWEVRQGVQGGFLVSRPSVEKFQAYLSFIREGNYVRGRGNDKG